MMMGLDDYLTNRTETVQFQGKKYKVNHLTNGTPQGSNQSQTLFNMVINQLLQLNMGSKVQMIETKAMQQGLKFYSDKCEALWYRSNDPDWNFNIAGEEIPWRASVKYLGIIIDQRLNFRKQVDYVTQKN